MSHHSRTPAAASSSAALPSLLSAPLAAARCVLTPSQMLGLFYLVTLPSVIKDNDPTGSRGPLTVVPVGQIADLSGRVSTSTAAAGRPADGDHCDDQRPLPPPRDPRRSGEDPDFQGYGPHLTDADGRYRSATIRPVPHPGRIAAHPRRGVERRASLCHSRIYVAGELPNQRDWPFHARAPRSARVSPLLADFVAAWTILSPRWRRSSTSCWRCALAWTVRGEQRPEALRENLQAGPLRGLSSSCYEHIATFTVTTIQRSGAKVFARSARLHRWTAAYPTRVPRRQPHP